MRAHDLEKSSAQYINGRFIFAENTIQEEEEDYQIHVDIYEFFSLFV
jgi:hypothetical protein